MSPTSPSPHSEPAGGGRRLEPLSALRQEMEQLLGRLRNAAERLLGETGQPPVDVLETDDAVQVLVDLPGVPADEIDLQLRGGTLVVSGERVAPRPPPGRAVRMAERREGPFERRIPLPCEVDEQQASAVSRRGVLIVQLPKRAAGRGKRIVVERPSPL